MFETARQIAEFTATTNAALAITPIFSDPSLYRRINESRDAVIRGRRQQRRLVMHRKNAYLENAALMS